MAADRTLKRIGDRAAPSSAHSSRSPPRAITPNADNLAYLSDLILELKRISERSGFEMLTEILALAHSEARRQTDRVAK